jgi:hypothetical protein
MSYAYVIKHRVLTLHTWSTNMIGTFTEKGISDVANPDVSSLTLQPPKPKISTKVDCFNASNTCHLLPTNFGFSGLEWTTNNCSSSLMIPQILKFLLWQVWWPFGIFGEPWPLLWHSPHIPSDWYLGPTFQHFSLCDFRSSVDHVTLPLESRKLETWLGPNGYCPSTFQEFFLFLFGILWLEKIHIREVPYL